MAGNHIRRILYVQCIPHGKKKDKMGQRRRGLTILLPVESESALANEGSQCREDVYVANL
jgi:hypothetical protein